MHPLSGIRVVDISTTITGPLAAMLIGDLGAEVIKVERPGGDPFRSFRGGLYGPYFCAYNRNKRSVVIDVNDAIGFEKLGDLIASCDVLIDNYRPGVLERLGLGPANLQLRTPRLIHCSITGFGSTGPLADRPAYDAVAQATSGISSLFLDAEDPHVLGPTISDNVTGMYAALAIASAIVERNTTGKGRRIEVNMLETSIGFIPDAFANFNQLGVVVTPTSRPAASQSYAFRCRDGKLIAIHLSSLDKFWTSFVEALGASDLLSDLRFKSRMDRVENYATLEAIVAARLVENDRSAWLTRFATFDFAYAPINTIPEALEDPQVRALKVFFEVTHPTEGPLSAPHAPYLFDGERVTGQLPPPTLGEHNSLLEGPASAAWSDVGVSQ